MNNGHELVKMCPEKAGRIFFEKFRNRGEKVSLSQKRSKSVFRREQVLDFQLFPLFKWADKIHF